MLRVFSPEDRDWLNETLRQHMLENVYLYIDTQTYGFQTKDIMTWISQDEFGIKCIIYRYYNSLQLFQTGIMNDSMIMEICNFINHEDFNMISGERKLLNQIHEHISQDFQFENGYIFKMSNPNRVISNKTEWANYEQCEEIAKLICSDQSIGGHYSVSLLQSQLEDRMLNWGCRNKIILENGIIVSHMATYAELDNIAVMAGLITREDFRGKGLGNFVLTDLALALLQENKIPVLYCYKETLWDWYLTLGWEKVQSCAKLER